MLLRRLEENVMVLEAIPANGSQCKSQNIAGWRWRGGDHATATIRPCAAPQHRTILGGEVNPLQQFGVNSNFVIPILSSGGGQNLDILSRFRKCIFWVYLEEIPRIHRQNFPARAFGVRGISSQLSWFDGARKSDVRENHGWGS